MFHSENGLFFNRNEDGSVTIIKTCDGLDPINLRFRSSNVMFTQTIPEGVWCSIMCNVSLAGGGNLRWFRAETFHSEPVESFSPE